MPELQLPATLQDRRRAAVNPVGVAAVPRLTENMDPCAMDMAANDAVQPALAA